jgi:hypothetical protein
VRSAHLLPLFDVGDVNPSPHDIFQAAPQFLQSCFDVLKSLDGLGIGSPCPVMLPSSVVAVVPETRTHCPTRTALE